MAATRATQSDLDALGDALWRMAEAQTNVEGMVAADLDFHRLLLAATHNTVLVQIALVCNGTQVSG
jgi:DNA-binding FadR family transcriptional regulator